MRPVSPLEVASIVAIGGSILAVGVPGFVRNLHASRLVEPIEGLERIAARATALAAQRPAEFAYPPSVEQTPEQVPRGKPTLDPARTWERPTWRLLDFEFSLPHSYSFAFESHNTPGHATFYAVAHGDLDGDGLESTFEVSGESKDGSPPIVFPMESRREIE
jgi:type IV pilus assembly protein PilA